MKFRFPLKPLKHLLSKKPQYGSNQAGIDRISEDEARYIRITDIDEYGLLKDDLGATAEFVEEKYVLNNNDILFARSGATVGKAFLHKSNFVKYTCFYAGYMIRFIVNEDLLLPDFLFYYTQLDVYKEWKQAIQRAAGQPNINAEEYSSLLIPLPHLETQVHIVSLLNAAYEAKRHKEAEAKQLLESIDSYILEQLGISMPTPTESKKTFYTNIRTISGGRFDPYYYQAEFEELERSLCSGNYQVKSFQKLASKITSGTTPISGGDDYTTKEFGIPFIRSGEINEFDEIDFDNCIYIKAEIHNKTMASSKLKKNDLMIAIVGATIGQVGVYKYEIEANINQAIAIVRFRDDIDIEFIKSFLLSSIGQKILDRLKRPVARANINLEEVGTILVPVPPLSVQEIIASHISSIRIRAKQLENEATAAIEAAKREVERMIIGEGI